MFNVCLIQPPIEDFYATGIRNIPLGLLSIGATLKTKHNVSLLDLRHGKSRKIPIPGELTGVAAYYRPADTSPFALYKTYARFGAIMTETTELIPEKADVFLVSALFSAYIYEALEIITLIRRKNTKAAIIAGGSGAVFHSPEFFNAGADFIIRGEGEIACARLLDELKQAQPDFASVPNLIWRNGRKIHTNPVEIIENINRLPFPDYSIPGAPGYRLKGRRHAMIMASRGCPFHCRFCSIHQIFGSKYRLRSVYNVLAELEDKIAQGFRSFDFEDDHFGGNKRWLNRLLDGILAKFTDYKLSFQAMNGITAGNLDTAILEKMKRAGFTALNLSLVTPDLNHQKALQRPFDTAQFISVVEAAARIGLQVTAYLIVGLPGDTAADNLNSILFLAGLPVLIGPSLLYLVPGTAIFSELKTQGEIPDSPRCYRSSYFPYDRREFSRTSAMTLFRICRIINFMKAAREYRYQPSEYRLENDAVIIPPGLSGKQTQITLGFALLELLKQTGKIYGTRKKQGRRYPIIEELCDTELIAEFLSRYQL